MNRLFYVWVLGVFAVWAVPAQVEKPKNPLGDSLKVVAEGQSLYNKTCTGCHGKTGHETPQAASAQCTTCHSYHLPGQAPKTPQDRTFDAIGLPAGVKPRGMLAF